MSAPLSVDPEEATDESVEAGGPEVTSRPKQNRAHRRTNLCERYEQHYVHGANDWQDVACPAQTAGLSPESIPGKIISNYDDFAKQMAEDRRLIPESKAKNAWEKALQKERQRDSPRSESAVEAGREVMQRLGWL